VVIASGVRTSSLQVAPDAIAAAAAARHIADRAGRAAAGRCFPDLVRGPVGGRLISNVPAAVHRYDLLMASTRPRVLVVDDDEPTCRLLAAILRRAGYEPTIAVSADEALRAVRDRGPFDLATVDVVMPQTSGDQLAAILRSHDPDLKVLFVTGYPEALFQAQPHLWKGEAFLEKPCSDRGIVEAVSLLLTGRIAADAPRAGETVEGGDSESEPIV
jgi:CheY-like chemotaxis protein